MVTAGQAHAAEAAPASGPIFSFGELGRRAGGVADGGDDEVLQRLDVVRVDGLRVDRRARPARRIPVTVAVTRPPPACPVTSAAASSGLRSLELLLHLLRLLHQLLHVRLTATAELTTTLGHAALLVISHLQPFTCGRPEVQPNRDTRVRG